MTTAILWSLKDNHHTAVFSYVCKRPREGQTKASANPSRWKASKLNGDALRGARKIEDFRFRDARHALCEPPAT